ncbi:MAG: hypothetical protein KDB14_32260 [Planctomycetales bacterium]|nr:hypothetical protein [Planctomycetales bacterium]
MTSTGMHLRIHGDGQGRPAPLPCHFDEAFERLEALPRMFIEGDGSFVWRESAQWDGELIDGGPSLQCVELRGAGGAAELRRLLTCLSEDWGGLLIESVRDGRWSLAAEFLDTLEELPR